MIEELLKNNFFTGGFVLLITGAIMALMKEAPRTILSFLKRRFITEYEITNNDKFYIKFRFWMTKQKILNRIGRFIIITEDVNSRSSSTDTLQETKFNYIPSPGYYLVKSTGKFFVIRYDREQMKDNNSYSTPVFKETLKIIFLWNRSQAEIEKILNEVISVYQREMDNYIEILKPRYSEWSAFTRRKKRNQTTLFLKENQYENIYADIHSFINSCDWYEEKGIPWKRSYMLYGSPGGGKSSLIQTLASAFNKKIYIMNVRKLEDGDIEDLISCRQDDGILVFEEFDRIPKLSMEEKMSTLLNIFDGLLVKDGQITMFTANDISKIDQAFLRPGRVDFKMEISHADFYQFKNLFLKFFPDHENFIEKNKKSFKENKFSMSFLQELFISNLQTPEKIFEKLSIAKMPKIDPIIEKPILAGKKKRKGVIPNYH